MLSAAVLALLVLGRAQFVAAPGPRSGRTTIAVALAAAAAGVVLGYVLLTVADRGQDPATTSGQRLAQAGLGLIGIAGPVRFTSPAAASAAAVALLVLGAVGFLTVLAMALRPPGGPHPLDPEEERRLRELLDRQGDIDSLSYFALRDDRSVIFSPSGKAAVTYRVVGTVSPRRRRPARRPGGLARRHRGPGWTEARAFGWVPAVLAASERGAEAFHRRRHGRPGARRRGDPARRRLLAWTDAHARRPAGRLPLRAGRARGVLPPGRRPRRRDPARPCGPGPTMAGRPGRARLLDGAGPLRRAPPTTVRAWSCAATPTGDAARAAALRALGRRTGSPST